MAHNVPQASYLAYQGGSNQGRPMTYSQPNVVVGANRGQFRWYYNKLILMIWWYNPIDWFDYCIIIFN